jgi:fucose permease
VTLAPIAALQQHPLRKLTKSFDSSNAKSGGLERDFKLTSEQYSIIVLVFFISYLVCEVPANMILTRVRPSVFLPGLGLVWGAFAALMGATQNWHQLAGMRFLLGVAEVR